jgi:hypothetical protein
MIARDGRLTLIKSVFGAKPIHLMLIAEAPLWALEEIYKWMRGFFWAGKKKVNGGLCLVAWDKICKPKRFGGLGVKDLALQGIALRVRWEWLRRTDPLRPWAGLPAPKDPRAKEVFDRFIRIQVGNGNKILFWSDSWIGGRSVRHIAPLILQSVPTRTQNRRTVAQALVENRWVDDIQGELTAEAARQCVQLWACINLVDRDIEEDDVLSWSCSANGVYSAKSTYDMLQSEGVEFPMADAIWKNGAPLKAKIFMWLTIQHHLWTADRRHRHGLQDQTSSCFVCLQEEDKVEHLFTQCSYARQVWLGGFHRLNIAVPGPTEHCNLQVWWSASRLNFTIKTRKNFDALVILTCWSLWKNRNAWVFNNLSQQRGVPAMIDKIADEFATWCVARRGVAGVFTAIT